MQRIFGEAAARAALAAAVDGAEQREILRLLGDAALAEQVEWALMHRQRPLEHNRIWKAGTSEIQAPKARVAI